MVISMNRALPSCLALLVACQTGTPTAGEPELGRAKATAIIAAVRKIVTADGIEEQLEVPLGGTQQWIAVRGRDRANPILLMIHGGPASPDMPRSWAFQTGWEDYFTVVQWDQRGAGKTFGANDPATISPTLSLERITEDASELVQFLRTRYGKAKVFVLGHSWGTLVGLGLAHRHPEWLHAYVGMGQLVNGQDNERVGYALTLEAARAAGNAQAVEELKAIAPYPEADGSLPIPKLSTERQWSIHCGGLTHGRDILDYYSDLAILGPEYTAADVAALDRGSELSLPRLLPDLAKFDYTDVTHFDCPIIVFAGRYDTTTPSSVAAAWIARVHAPKTQLIWFEQSAHMIMFEEPGRVLVHLVEDVLPLAGSPN